MHCFGSELISLTPDEITDTEKFISNLTTKYNIVSCIHILLNGYHAVVVMNYT